jgi:hypothetical protein
MSRLVTILNLAFLHGAELIKVCRGLHQSQLHFHPAGSISVEGEWELRDGAVVRIDGWHDGPDRRPYQLHRLLGRRLAGSDVSAPEWFAVRFEDGNVLRVSIIRHIKSRSGPSLAVSSCER